MRLIRDVIPGSSLGPCVVTMGNFDGLHRGHYRIIETVKRLAKQTDLPATVITFEPMPAFFLRPLDPFFRLNTLLDKLRILSTWGVDKIVCLRFNASLATLSADSFVQILLQEGIQAKHMVVGEDVRFGYQRQGDLALLSAMGERLGYHVHALSAVCQEGERVSSTAIRQALLKGDCARAQALLGRPFSITRRVVRGAQRGQQWGVPTANFALPVAQQGLRGVFMTRVTLDDDRHYWAVTNSGTRPSVGGRQYVMETHILDFEGYLYGKKITVEFFHKIREEKYFDSIAALRAAIQQDLDYANAWRKMKIG